MSREEELAQLAQQPLEEQVTQLARIHDELVQELKKSD